MLLTMAVLVKLQGLGIVLSRHNHSPSFTSSNCLQMLELDELITFCMRATQGEANRDENQLQTTSIQYYHLCTSNQRIVIFIYFLSSIRVCVCVLPHAHPDNGYTDCQSHIKVLADERTQIYSARSSLVVTIQVLIETNVL